MRVALPLILLLITSPLFGMLSAAQRIGVRSMGRGAFAQPAVLRRYFHLDLAKQQRLLGLIEKARLSLLEQRITALERRQEELERKVLTLLVWRPQSVQSALPVKNSKPRN